MRSTRRVLAVVRRWAGAVVGTGRDQATSRGGTMSREMPEPGRLPAGREALLRTTLALGVDERVAWLEAMMAIAVDSGALPKRVPDQLAGARMVR